MVNFLHGGIDKNYIQFNIQFSLLLKLITNFPAMADKMAVGPTAMAVGWLCQCQLIRDTCCYLGDDPVKE